MEFGREMDPKCIEDREHAVEGASHDHLGPGVSVTLVPVGTCWRVRV